MRGSTSTFRLKSPAVQKREQRKAITGEAVTSHVDVAPSPALILAEQK